MRAAQGISIRFVYLGRSPAFGGFVREIARAARQRPDFKCEFIVAAGTELAERLSSEGTNVFTVGTFIALRGVAHLLTGSNTVVIRTNLKVLPGSN